MDPATAARVTASSSVASSRSSSSPSTSKLAHYGSATGLNGEQSILGSIMSMDQALANHANAPDPVRAALEAILLERNTLSSQNSQLWNHLKKQRNNYQLAVSDVKRLRNERDVLRAKLSKYEHGGSHDERRLRPSASAANMSANVSVDTHTGANDSMYSEPSPSTSLKHPSLLRQDSEDSAVSKRSNLKDQRSRADSQSAMREVPRSQQRERSNTHPEFSTSETSMLDNGPASPTTSSGGQHTTSPPPLVIPARADSFPSGSTTAGSDPSPSQHVIVTDQLKDVEDPLGTAKPNLSSTIPSISTPSQNGFGVVQPLDLHPSHSNHINTHPPSSTVALTPNYLSAGARKASRESRISLPDEARRYFANLADSPLSSPRVSGNSESHVQRPVNGDQNLYQLPEENDSKGTDSASPRPFLELETTDDSESEHRMSGDNRVRETDSDPEGEDAVADPSLVPNRDGSPAYAGQIPNARGTRTTATADQFPLPPSSLVSPLSTSPQSPTRLQYTNGIAQSHGGSDAKLSSSTSQWSSAVASSTTLAPETSSRRTREKADSFIMPTNLPAASFRQMPLLNTDLKTTSVEVLGSHIRANSKGKEVLSFVIAVHVIGKESWQIEKFYSDVLALENRLRTMCSRSTQKKLEPLPDNKLFKDHAPAKVDQRKRMLQAFLQSVINLPIKDKNDIVVFFSSDIVRERSPVTKSGYKEGYLTKRGKNFGGWKTRYFVLQGPVLEYYESRGGTHLGSIHITGAQIGRQQRGNAKDDDDENEFRHAFLIIEQRRGPAGQNTRHVLCAESDKERDAWVDVLVKYVMGSYEDERVGVAASPVGVVQSRTSTSSLSVNEPGGNQGRRPLRDLIHRTDVTPVPISQLSMDSTTAKFFPGMEVTSPSKSPVEKGSVSSLPFAEGGKASFSSDDAQQSSSLPVGSALSEVNQNLAPIGQRSNSELGHYPDMQGPGKSAMQQEHARVRETARASYHPSLGTIQSSPRNRSSSPEKASPAASSPSAMRDDGSRLGKISGPLNGAPIPAGYKFGGKDPTPEPQPSERERKARSRAFWKWPTGADKAAAAPALQPRAVFGVPLEEALAVSQVANLPSIVFRSIQYLESMKADEEEGIYRLSGSSAVIKNLKDRFNSEGDVNLLEAEVHDPHAIAGLLKTFFRELPSSLLTRELHMRFLAVMDFVDVDERVKELQILISQLPLANYSLLRALTAHLIRIVQNSSVNKMTMRNVGIVFSPTLGIPAGVFSLMLGEFNRVFNVNGEGSDSSADDEEAAPAAPRRSSGGLSRRNSQRYSDAAADQLLGLSGRALPVTEEDRSDGEEESMADNGSDGDETENEAEDTQVASDRANSPAFHYHERVEPPPEEQDALHAKSRASMVATSRGLNLNLTGSMSKADRRRSRIPPGLPPSPRPTGGSGQSPLNTPTFVGMQSASPYQIQR